MSTLESRLTSTISRCSDVFMESRRGGNIYMPKPGMKHPRSSGGYIRLALLNRQYAQLELHFQNQGPSIPCKSVYTSFNRDRPYRRCVIQLRMIIHVICFDGNVEWCGSCPSEAQDIPSWFLIRTHPLKKMSLLAREGTAADPPISDHAHPSRDWNWVIFTLSLVPFSALFFSMGAG